MKRALLCLCVVFVLLLTSCTSEYEEINADDVDLMTVWNDNTDTNRALEDDEANKVLELYNAAPKQKKSKNDGDTTPSFGLRIDLKNEEFVGVFKFGFLGHSLEVHTSDGDKFFVDSEELADYIEGLK